MKTPTLIHTILLSLASLVLASCGDENKPIPQPEDDNIDTSLNCKDPQDVGNYSTFYKPPTGWVGDPMPFYNESDQTFYVFHLQDWRNGSPQDHPIFYTKTKDFANFQGFYEAIPCGPNEQSQDIFLGTGSFIRKDGKCYGFYTGHNGRLNPKEKIMLAVSTDMQTWTKVPEFTFEAPDGYDKNNFRDPCVYYDPYRKAYVLLITTLKNGKACLARYSSDNLIDWTNIEPLTDFESDAEIMECPDIFEMGGKWYLFFSRINRDAHRKTFYRIADTPEGPWRIVRDSEGHHETLDGRFLYAGKTVSDGQNRYLCGWCSSDETVNSSNELGWAGSLITHKLARQSSGRLYPLIPEAVKGKYTQEVKFKAIEEQGSVSGEKGNFSLSSSGSRSYAVFNRNLSEFRITMTIDASQSDQFGISFGACDTQNEVYSIAFDLNKTHWGLPCVFLYYDKDAQREERDFTPLVVPANKQFKVEIIAEKTICTTYINDQVAFTCRIKKMHQNPWMIYVDRGSVQFSNINVYSK